MLELIETVSSETEPRIKNLSNGHCPVHSRKYDPESETNSISCSVPTALTTRTSRLLIATKMVRYSCSFVIVTLLSASIILFITELTSSSLLEARLNFVNRLLKETPLIAGHCSAKNDNFYQALGTLEMNHISAIFWPISVPCGAQFLDAVQLCLEKFDEIKRQISRTNDLVVIENADDLQKAHLVGNISVILGIEGGHSLGDSLAVLRSFFELGTRFITISHSCDTVWAKSSNSKMSQMSDTKANGLSEFGRNMILEMNRLGVIIDLSKVSEQTALDILATTQAPIVFSHAVTAHVCNSSDNAVSDNVLQQVSLNGGIVMIDINASSCIGNEFDLFHFLFKNLKHIRIVAGVNHVGFGTVDAQEQYPLFLAELARQQDWSTSDIKKLIGANLLRVFQEIDLIKHKLQSTQNALDPLETIIPIDNLEDSTYCRFPDI